jgi:hypothetical protein
MGDTTGNKTVSNSDVTQTRDQVGMAVTSSNFRENVRVTAPSHLRTLGWYDQPSDIACRNAVRRIPMSSLVPATQVAAFTSFARAPSKAKTAALLLLSVAVLLTGGAPTVRGQSALDGFDPNANGTVNVVVTQPDGKILLGGSFTSVLGVARNRIARLNPDGTLDTAFNPNANSTVSAIAVQADGKILAGG